MMPCIRCEALCAISMTCSWVSVWGEQQLLVMQEMAAVSRPNCWQRRISGAVLMPMASLSRACSALISAWVS